MKSVDGNGRKAPRFAGEGMNQGVELNTKQAKRLIDGQKA